MSKPVPAIASTPARSADAGKVERLVVVCDDVWPSAGAGAVARENILQALAQGLQVSALLGDARSACGLPAEVEIVPLFGGALSADGGMNAAIAGVFHLGVLRRAARWIAERDTSATIYHLHNWHKSLSPSIFHALRRVESRLLMTAHDYFLTCPNGAHHNFRKDKPCELAPLSGSCLAENCDKRSYLHKAWRVVRHGTRAGLFSIARMSSLVLAPHADITPHLVRAGVRPDRIKIVPHGVIPWTSQRVIAERQALALFVGRLERDKGAALVAEAADRRGLSLTFVGDGPLAAPLARSYPRHRFLGRKTRAELAGIAAQTRLLVVAPSWRETFGLVTFEAVMSGVPTLISRNALVADELSRLDAAQAFNGDDIDDCASSMSRLFHDTGRLAELSANGFALRGRLAPVPGDWGRNLMRLYRKTVLEANFHSAEAPCAS